MKTKNQNKVIWYLREDAETKKNQSIKNQEISLMNYCQKHRMEILKIFSDYGDGNTLDRPEWKKLETFLSGHRNEKITLLVFNFSRCTRKFIHAIQIIHLMKETGTTIIETETGKDITQLFYKHTLEFVLNNIKLKVK